MPPESLPRAYPVGFGHELTRVMSTWKPQPKLRQKREIDCSLTDLELFNQMSLDDLWIDAELVDVYRYLRRYKPHTVPPSWETTMEKLDAQLESLCPSAK